MKCNYFTFTLAVLFFSSLQSCGISYLRKITEKSVKNVEDYEKILNDLKDKNVNSLLESWGPPSDIFNLSNGNKMYTWDYVGNTYESSNYNETINQGNTTSYTKYCETTFTINTAENIISWTYRGNACTAYILPKSNK